MWFNTQEWKKLHIKSNYQVDKSITLYHTDAPWGTPNYWEPECLPLQVLDPCQHVAFQHALPSKIGDER